MATGVQFPSFSHTPKASHNQWEDVRDLCKAYGLVLDPWQEYALQASLGERADGRWAATRVGLSVPRQSGKTALFEARELAGLLLFGEQLIIHSAHLLPTAIEAFGRIKHYFENYDDLRKLTRRIREGNGDQAIEMMDGSRLIFRARAGGSGRGFSADCLMLDEAQILGQRAWAAMLPTMSARPNPQAWLAGTPPRPDDDGEAFTRMRESAHGGGDHRLAWMEWGANGPHLDVSDRKLWAQANPGLGYRITNEAIADELHSLDPATFARERLGRWDQPEDDLGVIDLKDWAALKGDADPPDSATLAVDVSPDRRRASIGVAADTPDGRLLVMVVTGPGTAWVVPEVVRLRETRNIAEVAVQPNSAGGLLIPDLVKAGIEFETLTSTQVGQATAAFIEGVKEKRLVHVGQHELDAAVGNAKTRFSGDYEIWDRRNRSIDISPLVAASVAAFRVSLPAKSKQSFAF